MKLFKNIKYIKNIKYAILVLALVVLGISVLQSKTNAAVWVPPSYENNFTQYLTNWTPDSEGRVESVYDLWIDRDKSLKDNIRCLFYPNSYMVPWCNSASAWGKIRDVARYIWFALLVMYLVMAGIDLIMDGRDSEKVKTALKSLIFILYWSLLFFGVTWILWWILSVETVQWSAWLVDALQWWPDSLFFKILTALKALAFFMAIIMIVFYGFRIMNASDQADKIKTLMRWIMNVVMALVIIKVIDYVYYIAQLPSFTEQATEFIMEIAKIMWFIMWSGLVLMIFYAWFLLLVDQWKSENMKKAKNIIVWVLMAALVVFVLLLVMYQLFAEFA